jgi:hypothetical protein
LQVLFLTIESVDHLEVIISQEQEKKQQQQQQQLDSANRLLHPSKNNPNYKVHAAKGFN